MTEERNLSSARTNHRLTLRAIDRNEKGSVRAVIEQSIQASEHEVGLALRRDPFRRLIALALLDKGTVTLEVKK